jgi:RHS repeat-associated protein
MCPDIRRETIPLIVQCGAGAFIKSRPQEEDVYGSVAPFGEELAGDASVRTPARGYVEDNVRQRFTGYERDEEIGLDYARARYYSGQQGRFTSPDPLLASGRPASPQSWNRYAYVLNNPLRLTDPSGLTETQAESARQQTQSNSNTPPPPPPLVFKNEIPLVAHLPEHEEGGAIIGPGVETVPALLTDAAEKILQGVYNDSYYSYYPEAARDAVQKRLGTTEPSGEAVQNIQVENAEIKGTVAKAPSADVKVGVLDQINVTKTSTILPRLEGEINTRVIVLTGNANAIDALTKLGIPVRHGNQIFLAPIDKETATTLVGCASGRGQNAATNVTRNALSTVP